MTTHTKFLIALIFSAALATYGAYEILHAFLDPILKALGS